MGIKGLFKLIRELCPDAIETGVNLEEYSGRKVVVDVSNYAYKHIGFGLVSGFTRMLLVFRNCYIEPIFVFDGEAGELKGDTLQKRRQTREAARDRHQAALQAEGPDAPRGEDLYKLERAGAHVGADQMKAIFQVIDTFRATGTISSGESDPLMAAYVLDGGAAAAVSADSDMLTYGVEELITNLDTSGLTCTRVRLSTILDRLQLTMDEFRDLCIVLGTDYNKNPPRIGYKGAYSKINIYRNLESIETHMRGQDPTYQIGFDYNRIRQAFTDVDIEETPYEHGPALTLDALQKVAAHHAPSHLAGREAGVVRSLYLQLCRIQGPASEKKPKE